ncbi:peroxidase 5-like protein [Cinnamomum micranthum f. kanehirae]|uniref:Peroxidase n=1 Tax=Cinnamomum micranthum f. kanehirae TaxID=337451 RepID=A0A443NN88_9MAGN|nr:peroxidase 5-like protein [Cinnamomum micranthum f. kanehirae]
MSIALNCMFLMLLVASSAAYPAALIFGFYNQTCPSAEELVRQTVTNAYANNSGIGAGLIRMHFHDCFVRGCDGSVLIDSTANNTAEKDAVPNNPSLRGFEVIDAAKAAIEAQCPGTVSCADILAFAARDGAILAGNISYQVPAGRRDGRISIAAEADEMIPAPTFNATQLVDNFKAKNLTAEDMVTLSGAHSIGVSHCTAFVTRLYNASTSTGIDPTISSAYAELLRLMCPSNVTRNDSRTVALDIITPNALDNKYYVNVNFNLALFTSDHALTTNSILAAIVNIYVKNGWAWADKFAQSMVKMGYIEVKTGTEGEIRTNCRVINPASSLSVIETLHGYDHASS